jgi:hypothetical protein
MAPRGCASIGIFQPCSYIHFEHTVTNPGSVASLNIGGLEKHTFDLRVPVTPVVLSPWRKISQNQCVTVLPFMFLFRYLLGASGPLVSTRDG